MRLLEPYEKEYLRQKWFGVRVWFKDRWTSIPEENRNTGLKIFSRVVNYLFMSVLLSVPFSMLGLFSYKEWVIFFWFALPVWEHYWRWHKRDWRDDTKME